MRLQILSLQWGMLFLISLSASGGCGKSDELNRQAMSGKITLDGQPLDQGTIEFTPSGPDAKLSSGAIISAGDYSIPAEKGLPPGTYRVRISAADASTAPAETMPGETGPPAQERIPAEYNSASEKIVTVSDNGPNDFSFDIQSAK